MFATLLTGALASSLLNKAIILQTIGLYFVNFVSCGTHDMQNRECTSAGCIEAACTLQKYMDTRVDACENFYKFACGKFLEEAVIPEDEVSASLFNEKIDKLQKQLKTGIELGIKEGDPKTFKLVQSLYKTCLDTDKMDKANNTEVKAILKELGGWPVVAGNSWNKSNFDKQEFVYRLRELGYEQSVSLLISFDVAVDNKNTSRRLITVGQAETGLSAEYLSQGLKEPEVQAYYEYMVHLAEILGAERDQAKKELAESLNFEIELAKILKSSEGYQNMSQLYSIMTVEELQSKYPAIPWVEHLNKILAPKAQVELTEEINVINPKFFESFPKLLAETPKRVLANYMVWMVVQESAAFMNKAARDARREYHSNITGTMVESPRWEKCIDFVSSTLPQAIGALYVRTSFDKNTKGHVENLVKEMRESFDRVLEEIDWMDEETKKVARLKLDAIREHVAYPDEFLDDQELDRHFGSLKIDPNSFFMNYLQTNLFLLDYSIGQLRKPVDKTDWVSHGISAEVNAFYNQLENSIQIPAGILQGEFFTDTRPNYMNYGSAGWIIGHEFTHAFDDEGSQFDENGNIKDWWDSETKTRYSDRAQCIIDQYSNYTVEEVGLNVNGKATLGENISDNGGIREAYVAYESFEKKHGHEPRLPGLPYSPRQLFWISAANVWCQKVRPEVVKFLVRGNEHSPAEFRVIGSFSNMPQFARDFGCRVGSTMNPAKKCTFW